MQPDSNSSENPPAAEPSQAGQVFNPGGQVTVSSDAPGVVGAAERPTAVTGPSVNNQAILPQVIPAGTVSKPPKRRLYKKPMVIALAAVLVLAGGSAAAYFGYYQPNQPENIWASALSNTGKGYDKLTQYTQTQFGGQNKGVKLSGNFKSSGFLAADGSFSGSSDGDNGEFTGSLSATGVKVNLDARIIKSDAGSPDIYFKLDGLQGIGTLFSGAGSQYAQALNGINGKWYFVDHTLFDQFAKGTNSSLQISQSDVKSVLRAIGDAGKQNIFTSDPNKMAFVVKQNVGKEKQDGRNVYHFKAAIQKDNLKAFVNTLCANLKNSSLKKFFNNDGQAVGSALDCDNTSKAVDNFNSDRTADVWVDLHTRLIHKVRFTDPSKHNNYFEAGQDYQGGDSFPFFLNFHIKDSGSTNDSSINLSLNMKTNTLSLKGSTQASGNDNTGGNVSLNVSPNQTKVKVEKPANAKNLIELLNDLGLNDLLSGSQSSANDVERKTDINALQGQIEAYSAEKGYYPILANINDAGWRAANMKGLDAQALKDPGGSAAKIAASPAAHVYSYQTTPVGCDNHASGNCTDYTLTATLDSGGPYVKQSLTNSNFYPQTNVN